MNSKKDQTPPSVPGEGARNALPPPGLTPARPVGPPIPKWDFLLVPRPAPDVHDEEAFKNEIKGFAGKWGTVAAICPDEGTAGRVGQALRRAGGGWDPDAVVAIHTVHGFGPQGPPPNRATLLAQFGYETLPPPGTMTALRTDTGTRFVAQLPPITNPAA